MARARNIKPGFFSNEDLVEFDFATRLLFVGLWTVADRDGRLQDRPKKIKIDVFPADNLDVDAMLTTLHNGGFIIRYEVNGAKFIQITNWMKHQNPHHTEKASDIPAHNGELTVKQLLETGDSQKQDGGNLADSLIPDSGFTDSLIHDSSAARPPTAKRSTPPSKRKISLPDGFGVSAAVTAWAAEKGFGQLDAHLDAFTRKAKAKGYTYVDWDAAFMEAIREDWAKLRGRAANGAAPPPDSTTKTGTDAAEATRREREAREKGAAPPPAHIRAQLASLTKKLTGAMA